MRPVNRWLVPIHNKYFVRNLTLHHFLLSPEVWNIRVSINLPAPLEFFFQEQSYSSLHSGRSSTLDHVRGDINDPCGAIAEFCGVIADFCGVIADPCGVVAIPEAIGGPAGADRSRLAKHHKTL